MTIKTAMVMAGGKGTRMLPLTEDRCKAMVRVDGKYLIDHVLDRLDDASIERAVVNVHAFADDLEAHLKTRQRGPQILISDERDRLLETGGGLVKALPLLGDDPFLICNMDALWVEFMPILPRLIASWQPHIMDNLFLLAPKHHCLGYNGKGDFTLDAKGRVQRGVDGADYVFAGVEVFSPKLAKGYPLDKYSRTVMWKKPMAAGRSYGHVIDGYWMHVGDPDARKAAETVLTQVGRE